MNEIQTPPLQAIQDMAARLAGRLVVTPVQGFTADGLPPGLSLELKLEFQQHTGSCKARSALAALTGLPQDTPARRVLAVGAGNHALATAWAAAELGLPATILVPCGADPLRVARLGTYNATIEFVPDVAQAFDRAIQAERDGEGSFVHPFDGPHVAAGTGTLALEWLRQSPGLEAIVVAVGGGGLIGGISAAIKQACPHCRVFGVEPEGADALSRSLRAGVPQRLDEVDTIADSLGAPYMLPYSFELCRRHVDEVACVPDESIVDAMRLLHAQAGIVCEPAGAAALAGLLGPLGDRIGPGRVGVLVCGSNISHDRFAHLTGL